MEKITEVIKALRGMCIFICEKCPAGRPGGKLPGEPQFYCKIQDVAADLLEQQQTEIKQITKDRDQWRVAAEASRDVIQPKLRAEIEELEVDLNKAIGMVELAVNDIPHICETCGIENRVNPDCYCNQNLNPNTYIHSAWEWQYRAKLNEMKGELRNERD